MKWTVIYSPKAQRELALIWLRAADQQLVADAADAIDRLLSFDPTQAGESRDQKFRIIMELPLVFEYEVRPDDYLVRVLSVRYIRRRQP